MKKLLSAVLCLALMFCAPAGVFAQGTDGEWSDSTPEEIMERLGLRFGLTEDMEITSYQIGTEAAQMQFLLNGAAYTARIQPTNSFENISDYELDSWAISDTCMIGWCDATAMMAQIEGQIIALCLWYDAAPGLMYSVSACAEDLKGLDIQSAAEAVFAPMQDEADVISSEDILNALTACTGYAGTAGSSLKNAIAAYNLATFAADHQLADLDELFLSETVSDALTALTEDQAAELTFNLESIHSVLTDAFTDYSSIRDLFDTAGIAEEMDLLVAAELPFEHYSALYDQILAAGL